MCLDTRYIKISSYKQSLEDFINLHKKIAKKDIIAYKVLNNDNLTPYKNFKIKENTHYYNHGENKFSIDLRILDKEVKLSIRDGLHAYKTLQFAKTSFRFIYHRKIVKVIIPKGSEYFENDKEICADNMIYYSLKDIRNK